MAVRIKTWTLTENNPYVCPSNWAARVKITCVGRGSVPTQNNFTIYINSLKMNITIPWNIFGSSYGGSDTGTGYWRGLPTGFISPIYLRADQVISVRSDSIFYLSIIEETSMDYIPSTGGLYFGLYCGKVIGAGLPAPTSHLFSTIDQVQIYPWPYQLDHLPYTIGGTLIGDGSTGEGWSSRRDGPAPFNADGFYSNQTLYIYITVSYHSVEHPWANLIFCTLNDDEILPSERVYQEYGPLQNGYGSTMLVITYRSSSPITPIYGIYMSYLY